MALIFRTEHQFEQWFKERVCRPAGAYLQKVRLVGLRGFPDLVVVHEGVTAFYEVKIATCSPERDRVTRPTPIQRVTLERLARAGARAYCVLAWDSERVALWEPLTGEVGSNRQPTHPLLWLSPASPAAG